MCQARNYYLYKEQINKRKKNWQRAGNSVGGWGESDPKENQRRDSSQTEVQMAQKCQEQNLTFLIIKTISILTTSFCWLLHKTEKLVLQVGFPHEAGLFHVFVFYILILILVLVCRSFIREDPWGQRQWKGMERNKIGQENLSSDADSRKAWAHPTGSYRAGTTFWLVPD